MGSSCARTASLSLALIRRDCIQRQIARRLDRAGADAEEHDREPLRERVRFVLSIDRENAYTEALPTMATEALGAEWARWICRLFGTRS